MQTLNTRIAVFVDHCRHVRRLSPHTLGAYKVDLAQFATAIGITKITPVTVKQYVESLSEKGYAAASVKRKLATIRAFLQATDGRFATRAFAGWKLRINAPIRLPRAISRQEVTILLGAMERHLLPSSVDAATQLCISLMLATGIRVSELCSLNVGSVNISTGEIAVLGKGARERIVIIVNRDVRISFEKYIGSLPDKDDRSSPLFRNRLGNRLTPQCLRLRLHARGRRQCLARKVTPHMLRHTAATYLIESGVDIRFVQRLLGHASIATTQIYTHVSDQALKAALERADVLKPVFSI
jgi:integrase/recombinase XerD